MKLLRRDYSWRQLSAFAGSAARIAASPRRLTNLVAARLSSALGLGTSLGLPVDLFVEVTGRCDYECIKCGRYSARYGDDGPPGGRKELPLDQFRRLLDEVGETLLTLRLWHYGEPLLHPDLARMVAYAKRKGVVVAVSTNAARLDTARGEALARAGLDYLIVSFDGATRESYLRYHGRDRFEQVVENLARLVATRRRLRTARPFIDLQFIVMKENAAELAEVRAIARRIGVDKLTLLRLDDRDVCYGRFEGIDGPADVLPEDPRYRYGPARVDGSRACRLPWEEAVVRYSGVVLPCVCDVGHEHVADRLFGPAGERSFRSVWNGAGFAALRREVARNDGSPAMCVGCVQRNNSNEDQIA